MEPIVSSLSRDSSAAFLTSLASRLGLLSAGRGIQGRRDDPSCIIRAGQISHHVWLAGPKQTPSKEMNAMLSQLEDFICILLSAIKGGVLPMLSVGSAHLRSVRSSWLHMYACLIRAGVSQSARYVLCKNLSGCFEEVLSSLFPHRSLLFCLGFFLFLFLFF
jgi:hypothetical protein